MKEELKNKLFQVGFLFKICSNAQEFYNDDNEEKFNKNFAFLLEYIDYMLNYSIHTGDKQKNSLTFVDERDFSKEKIIFKKYNIMLNEYKLFNEDFMYLKILANIFYSIFGDRKNVYYTQMYTNKLIKEDIVFVSDNQNLKYDFLAICKNDDNDVKYYATNDYKDLVKELRTYPTEYEILSFCSCDKQKDKIALLKDMKEMSIDDKKQDM